MNRQRKSLKVNDYHNMVKLLPQDLWLGFLKIEASCKSFWVDSISIALADNLDTLDDLLRFPSIVWDLSFLDVCNRVRGLCIVVTYIFQTSAISRCSRRLWPLSSCPSLYYNKGGNFDVNPLTPSPPMRFLKVLI